PDADHRRTLGLALAAEELRAELQVIRLAHPCRRADPCDVGAAQVRRVACRRDDRARRDGRKPVVDGCVRVHAARGCPDGYAVASLPDGTHARGPSASRGSSALPGGPFGRLGARVIAGGPGTCRVVAGDASTVLVAGPRHGRTICVLAALRVVVGW